MAGPWCNLSRFDRIIRILLGAAIAAAGIYYRSWWGLLALLHNGLTGHCYGYQMFGISTNRGKHET